MKNSIKISSDKKYKRAKKSKKKRHYFVNNGPSSQGYGFSSGHVWMWELDYKESWAPKNWRFWTVVLEKTLESPLDFEEIQPVHPKGDQSWVFIGMTDAEAETPILRPPHAKSWLIRKDPDAGRDWGRRRRGDNRGWDGWMASPTQWTWVWVDSGSSWWTGRPGVLQSTGSQRVGHDWLTELNWKSQVRIYRARERSVRRWLWKGRGRQVPRGNPWKDERALSSHVQRPPSFNTVFRCHKWQPIPVLCLENSMDTEAW